jgi:hypothetical protein
MVTRLQVKVKTFFKEMQEMTENTRQNPSNPGETGHDKSGRSPLATMLGVLVSIEALLVTAGAIYFLSRIFLETPNNLSGAIVIFSITFIIAIGLFFTAIATFRAQQWTRGAIVTWQIMQFAIATSFIQGITEWQPVGWLLIALTLSTGFFVVKEMLKSRE